MGYIINSDPTLKFFIKDAHIDWFNDFQMNLRLNAIKIALYKYIDEQAAQYLKKYNYELQGK